MYNNKIHLYKKIDPLTLYNRAKVIFDTLKIFAEVSNCSDWFFSDKKRINFANESVFIDDALNLLKSRITKHTTIKVISDDYVDDVSSNFSFYGSNKFDQGLIVQGIISLDEFEFLIFNYEDVIGLNKVEKGDEFVSTFLKETGFEVFKIT